MPKLASVNHPDAVRVLEGLVFGSHAKASMSCLPTVNGFSPFRVTTPSMPLRDGWVVRDAGLTLEQFRDLQ